MNFSMLLILFGVSQASLLRRLQGGLLCSSGQVYDYPYNNGYIKICQNGQTVLNFVGTDAQCHCPEHTWNDNYTGKCITSCDGGSSTNNNICESGSGQIFDVPYNNGFVKICQNGVTVLNNVGTNAQCHCPEYTWNDNYSGKCINSCVSSQHPNTNDNLCQSGSGQIYDYPYNNGHVKICLNGQSIFNFIGTDAQCHCPEGTWNDNYSGQCINHCSSSQTDSNICPAGQIYGVPYNNGNVKICQNGKTVFNYVGTTSQCHCPESTWNDNYSGKCISSCDAHEEVAHGENLCQSGSGQIFDVPYNNGNIKVCLNGEIILNNVGTNAQCHCPEGTFNDNFTGQCILNCHSTQNENENLCQSGSGQIFDVPYNNGNVAICQNGNVVYNFVGTNAQCHCPQGTFNDNYTGQCVNIC